MPGVLIGCLTSFFAGNVYVVLWHSGCSLMWAHPYKLLLILSVVCERNFEVNFVVWQYVYNSAIFK